MKSKALPICTMIFLIAWTQAFAQRPFFNKNKDILIAQFDSKPDPDDIHAQAALGCMLAHPDLSGVNYYAVAGAIGHQGGQFIDSDNLFNMAFGNSNWTDADANWNASVNRVKNKVIPILQNGGKVWVQEAGQSNFTADWVAKVLQTVSQNTVKNNVVVVQHSNWNENKTTTSDLNYVKNRTRYFAIDDGNAPFNASWGDRGPWQTPEYRSKNSSWIARAKNSGNSIARRLWREADNIIDTLWPNGYPHDWSHIHFDGVDYSDCAENWWIFNIGGNADSVTKFWNRYVTNTPSGGGSTTVSLSPVQDAYLQGSSRFNNNLIRIESGNRVGYLKFNLSGISGNITSAELKMRCTGDAGNGNIKVNLGASNNWTENNLSNSNKPGSGALLGNLNSNYSIGNTYTWSLNTNFLNGGGQVSLIVSATGGNDVAFASKENSATEAQLVITYSSNTSRSNSDKVANSRNVVSQSPNELDSNLDDIRLFPNPISVGTFKIDLPVHNGSKNVSIFDSSGRRIYNMETLENKLILNSNMFKSKGFYFINVSSKLGNQEIKAIVK